MKKENYGYVDITKLFMAIMVVAIHTNALAGCQNKMLISVVGVIFKLAVPYFFIASGYFMGRKIENGEEKKINKQIVRMIKWYVTWSIIYCPLAIEGYIKWGYDFKYAVKTYFLFFFFCGDHYNSWQLWYLLSAIYALLFLKLVCKIFKNNRNIYIMFLSTFIIWGIHFINDFCSQQQITSLTIQIQTVLKMTICSGRIFTGLAYLPLGFMLASIDELRINIKVVILTLGVMFLGAIYVTNPYANDYCIFFCAILLFLLTTTRSEISYLHMRQLSTIVYFIHMWVYELFYIFVYGYKVDGAFAWLCTVGISLCVAQGVIYFTKKRTAITGLKK